MSDLINGIYPKPKKAGRPEFVLDGFSINVPQFREWMAGWIKENPGEEWLNVEQLLSKQGKPYAKVDDWKPQQPAERVGPPKHEEDIPF